MEHTGQPLLPWNDSEITPLRLLELFWDDYTIGILVEGRVPNSPTGQVLEAGLGWPVLMMVMIGAN